MVWYRGAMRVQIVYPEDGWILEQLARQLIDGLPYATGSLMDPSRRGTWDITYYVPYLLYGTKSRLNKVLGKPKNSRLVGGWFTHRGDERFEQIAAKVDFCVSPCSMSRDFLYENVTRNAHIIRHGIDLEKFRPRLRLGFIGKLQARGRKGEDIMSEIAKLPFVEIISTGGKLSADEIPSIYHQIDYVLITSTVEGGPLCFQEGLASGKEIISTHVGMVADFADSPGVHIYGDIADLKRILHEKYEERLRLRQLVEEYSLRYWVDAHDRLFRSLLDQER